MKGYKVFNPDWTCRGFKFEVGKVYEHTGRLELCLSGFHFCEKANDCFNYYSFDHSNKVAEIEAIGEVLTEKDKSVTDKIQILREVSWQELLSIVNIGKENTGYRNTGDYNTGHRNTGYRNTGYRNTGYRNTGHYNAGDYNTGYWNTGHRNTGDRNTGHYNAGDYNTGHRNTGYRNTGDYNTGDYNTGDYNKTNNSSGIFNTEVQNIKIFDKESSWTYSDWLNSEARLVLYSLDYSPHVWVTSGEMTDKEKAANPSHVTVGGFLREQDTSKIATEWWGNLSETDKDIIRALPNYDEKKFFCILGIKEEQK